MTVKIGKIYSYTKNTTLKNYLDIHFDMLWYLLHLTKVNRYTSRESLKEFLIRYLLITKTDLNQSALNFIDNGILIEGTINNEIFTFYVKDLINFMGFSCSDQKYNIQGALNDFVQEYQFKSHNLKFEQNETAKNTYSISQDVLLFSLMRLKHLLSIDSLSISFKENINAINEEELNKVLLFADFVMNNINETVFDEYSESFPEVKQIFKERHLKENVAHFDVYTAMERSKLLKIYELILPNNQLQLFLENGTSDDDLLFDLQYANTHIIFAYGVKHNYISLSKEDSSLIDCVNYSDLEIEYEDLLGEDGEQYTTQSIYDTWEMEKWIHLLP